MILAWIVFVLVALTVACTIPIDWSEEDWI